MELRLNNNQVYVGVNGGVARIASHLFEVKSNSPIRPKTSGPLGTVRRLAEMSETGRVKEESEIQSLILRAEPKYLVYIESICPQVGRCSCTDYVINGDGCKHITAALLFEKALSQMHPEYYREEKAEQKEHREAGRKRRPYTGSRQDEVGTLEEA